MLPVPLPAQFQPQVVAVPITLLAVPALHRSASGALVSSGVLVLLWALPQAPSVSAGAAATLLVGAEQVSTPVVLPLLAMGVTQNTRAWPTSLAIGVYCLAVALPMAVEGVPLCFH